MFSIVSESNQEVTMTSIDFLNNYINPARVAAGEPEIENRKFLSKVIDELDKTETDFFSVSTSTSQRPVKVLNLNHDELMLVGMRESKAVRKSVLAKLKLLSNPAPTPPVQLPQTKREWIEFALEQEKKLELAAPKVAFVDKLVSKGNLMNVTIVAQKHGLSAIKLNKVLLEHDVYSKSIKRGKVCRQWFVDKKYGEMKQTDSGFSQPMITNAGEVWINELLIAHGYI